MGSPVDFWWMAMGVLAEPLLECPDAGAPARAETQLFTGTATECDPEEEEEKEEAGVAVGVEAAKAAVAEPKKPTAGEDE
jgi:hypothetical protein